MGFLIVEPCGCPTAYKVVVVNKDLEYTAPEGQHIRFLATVTLPLKEDPEMFPYVKEGSAIVADYFPCPEPQKDS